MGRLKFTDAFGRPLRDLRISVTDRPEVVATVDRLISEIDVMPEQIEVSVKIIQLNRNKGHEHGIDWNVLLTMNGASRPTTAPWGRTEDYYFPGSFPEQGAVRPSEIPVAAPHG